MPEEEEKLPIKTELTSKEPLTTNEKQKHANDKIKPTSNVRAVKNVVGVLPDEVEEEEKEIVFFWPTVAFSDEIISMTPQNVRD